MNLKERVDQISATIQELRQASADGRSSRQLVDELFRTVHTFKAAAAAEGLSDLTHTAHNFENLLHALRTGQISLDEEVLRSCDETVVALRNGSQDSALGRLNELMRRPPASLEDLPPEFASLKDDERQRAAAAIRDGSTVYVMEVAFEVTDFDERFRRLKEQLERMSELVSTSATMKDDKILFQVVYASNSEKIPFQTVVRQAIRAGKAVASALGKQIEFAMKGDELLLDKPVSDVLGDALLHLVRNAVDHGIESHGKVLIEVSGEEVSVTDNGKGITPENLSLLFQPGFSTVAEPTEFSGRGVGLDVVKTAVENIGGSLSVTSEPGKGASFQIKIPCPAKIPNPSSDA